jgi:putative transcriptional regulator
MVAAKLAFMVDAECPTHLLLHARHNHLRKAIQVKNKLRELRAARQWSQADLAEMAGVSRQTINAIETEKYDPSLPLAFKLARLFTRPIEDIFEDTAG